MIKKILKKILPNYLWYKIKILKTIPTRVTFNNAQNEPAYLGFEQIKNLDGAFVEVAKYEYDEKSCRQRGEKRANDLSKIIADPKNKKILELGCSDAMTSVALKNKGYQVTALDLIDQRLAPAKNADIPFIKSTAENIPLETQSLDFVFSYNSLEHFTDPQKVLKEIHRILKPNGYFYADFDPLYYSPRGLHAYRKINIPYLQILFALNDLKKYADIHNLNWSELPYVNAYSLTKFRSIWSETKNSFLIKKYEEILDISALNIIKKYPSCFKKENVGFKNFITSGIKILMQKKK